MGIRLDGTYQSASQVDPDDGEEHWYYLWFRDNGYVHLISSAGDANDVADWIATERDPCVDPYQISGTVLNFWAQSSRVRLNTRAFGTVTGDVLAMRIWKSDGSADAEIDFTFRDVPVRAVRGTWS